MWTTTSSGRWRHATCPRSSRRSKQSCRPKSNDLLPIGRIGNKAGCARTLTFDGGLKNNRRFRVLRSGACCLIAPPRLARGIPHELEPARNRQSWSEPAVNPCVAQAPCFPQPGAAVLRRSRFRHYLRRSAPVLLRSRFDYNVVTLGCVLSAFARAAHAARDIPRTAGRYGRHPYQQRDQDLRRRARGGRRVAARRVGGALLPARAFGLRQDDPPAHPRGLLPARPGAHPVRRKGHHRRSAAQAPHGDGVPELRALASHDGPGEPGVRA